MTYNKHIYIAVGPRANAIYWECQCVLWLDFVERLSSPQRTGETADESLRDTLVDIANYATMAVSYLDREGKTDNFQNELTPRMR